MTIQFSYLFVIFASVFALSSFFDAYPLSWLVKILPMILLVYVALQSKSISKYFIMGLIFSLCGDVLLDRDRGNLFIFGLCSFLVAHLFYLVSLQPLTKKNLVYVLLYVGFGIGVFSVIAPQLNELFVPVLVYMSVLLLMAIATLLSAKSNQWLIVGGISFVISDALIGINKFYVPVPNSHFFIMSTYYLAQFGLTQGMLKQSNRSHEQHH